MNPLTQVKRTKEINLKEAALGISENASWHAKYKESPYVFVGGVPFDLTEGDLLAVFSQYGEIVDVNLVRDKATGKPKGFAFIAYEDQRSTNLAVDNLNGANVLGRTIRVDHVSKYKKKEEEDEEMEQQKREARGVCRAFQRGDCNRGAACKFSHNEQRAANTGWGPKEEGKWEHDKHENPQIKSGKNAGNSSSRDRDSHDPERIYNFRSDNKDKRFSRDEEDGEGRKTHSKRSEKNLDRQGVERRPEKESNHRDWDREAVEKRYGKYEPEPKSRQERDRGRRDEGSLRYESDQSRENRDGKGRSGRYMSEPNTREDCDGKGRERKSGRHESERNRNDNYDSRGGEKRSRYDEDSSSRHHR